VISREEFRQLERRVQALESVLDPKQRREARLIENALLVVAVAEAAGQLVEVLYDAATET
jgi:molybdopterin-biosynthesis enzyme MoeA-like protein